MAKNRDERLRWIASIFFLVAIWASWAAAQQPAFEDASNSTCRGVLLHYSIRRVAKISPFLTDAAQQPYRFESALQLSNLGFSEVKNWRAFVGFQHREMLVQAPGALLADGENLPVTVAPAGATLAGFPQTDLLNAVETAGDTTKTSVTINLVGTEYGVENFPLPANLSFPVPGYTCGSVQKLGNDTLQLCCTENATAINSTSTDQFALPEPGDLTITYSVIQTFTDNYWAEVDISNDNPLGRIDGWNLTWEWQQGEFIFQMRGAQTLDQDQTECLSGPAGAHYKDFDFSTVMSCNRHPTIVDLPPERANDTRVGMIPSCCRSGLLLPATMDPKLSKSAFQLFVYKVPPNLDRDTLAPPANFKIDPRYSCGQPQLIAPVEKRDPSSPTRMISAIKSWQVTCNMTRNGRLEQVGQVENLETRRKCCVSFSGFYNSSAVPCPTCACGCSANSTLPRPSCDTSSQAMLLPSYALLLPFQDRIGKALEWARMNRKPVPSVAPCSDNCPVSINWHVVSDFTDGWTARLSLLNWDETAVPEWFAAVELRNAFPGLERVYTLNGTLINDNTTLYFQGLPNYSDYLNRIDKNNPGKLQAVISFDKRKTPGINVTGGDGFPTRVVFNGEECALPDAIPISHGYRLRAVPRLVVSLLLAAVLAAFWL
ncbi:hypothetical protein SELMODRAFT_137554 [Selaginella moellendorffii]|uniref:COBRA C-terminal domain-containing protein n=1 Tax=Selaginella moellendorffii TaxID=88036 RepID=D8TDU1_SELML|nr:COBRA-like protein 7 [Selaginella moellendorffii]EFJ05170.1 hypothetical protein SELMODRAFT_137554 [Selaginella moellendorffii]|eukprot:XP_002993751.1 COBRA-like protein 7 [Selaginella moellendorffii]